MAADPKCRYCGCRIELINGKWRHAINHDQRCSLYASPTAAWGGR